MAMTLLHSAITVMYAMLATLYILDNKILLASLWGVGTLGFLVATIFHGMSWRNEIRRSR